MQFGFGKKSKSKKKSKAKKAKKQLGKEVEQNEVDMQDATGNGREEPPEPTQMTAKDRHKSSLELKKSLALKMGALKKQRSKVTKKPGLQGKAQRVDAKLGALLQENLQSMATD